MLYPSPTSGNRPQPAAATYIKRRRERRPTSTATTTGVSRTVSLCTLPSRATLTAPEWTLIELDATLTRTDTCYTWVTCFPLNACYFCFFSFIAVELNRVWVGKTHNSFLWDNRGVYLSHWRIKLTLVVRGGNHDTKLKEWMREEGSPLCWLLRD